MMQAAAGELLGACKDAGCCKGASLLSLNDVLVLHNKPFNVPSIIHR